MWGQVEPTVSRLPGLRPILVDNGISYLNSSGHSPQVPMIGPYWLRPSWILSRLEAHSGFLIVGEKRTRILEDMVVPGSFHVGKVIMILLSPVFVLSTPSFFFYSNSPQ